MNKNKVDIDFRLTLLIAILILTLLFSSSVYYQPMWAEIMIIEFLLAILVLDGIFEALRKILNVLKVGVDE